MSTMGYLDCIFVRMMACLRDSVLVFWCPLSSLLFSCCFPVLHESGNRGVVGSACDVSRTACTGTFCALHPLVIIGPARTCFIRHNWLLVLAIKPSAHNFPSARMRCILATGCVLSHHIRNISSQCLTTFLWISDTGLSAI
jgi:hypothetical protein